MVDRSDGDDGRVIGSVVVFSKPSWYPTNRSDHWFFVYRTKSGFDGTYPVSLPRFCQVFKMIVSGEPLILISALLLFLVVSHGSVKQPRKSGWTYWKKFCFDEISETNIMSQKIIRKGKEVSMSRILE